MCNYSLANRGEVARDTVSVPVRIALRVKKRPQCDEHAALFVIFVLKSPSCHFRDGATSHTFRLERNEKDRVSPGSLSRHPYGGNSGPVHKEPASRGNPTAGRFLFVNGAGAFVSS